MIILYFDNYGEMKGYLIDQFTAILIDKYPEIVFKLL